MPSADVDGIVACFNGMIDALGSQKSRDRAQRTAERLKPIGERTINLGGNRSMSNFRRGHPIDLEIAYTVHHDGIGFTMHRSGRSAGPFRTANDGRNQGGASGFHGPGIVQRGKNAGTTRRRKNGQVAKVRAHDRSSWSGRTAPKHTWEIAANAMQAAAPDMLIKATTADVMAAFHGR